MKTISHRQKTKWSGKAAFDQKIRTLYSELQEIWKNRRLSPSVKLETPIEHGWRRSFTLREDIKNRGDVVTIELILQLINHTVYSKSEDFTYKSAKGVRKAMTHRIKWIGCKRWEEEKYPEGWKKYFVQGVFVWKSSYRGGPTFVEKVWHFRWPWFFVPVVEKHYLTHYTPIDGELEAKMEQIHQWFDQNNAWKRWSNLHGHHVRERDYDMEMDRIENAELKRYMNDSMQDYIQNKENI